MRAMVLENCTSLDTNPEPLVFRDMPRPAAKDAELLIKVSACGVCHTELDEIEGRSAPAFLPVIPGHQVVGIVVGQGPGCRTQMIDRRVGVGWIHSSDGTATENLSPAFVATGRDVHGGYAEYMTVPEDYAYAIPDCYSDEQAAPLLCAGSIGYRALRLANICDGQFLGLTGFGGSGHLVLQLARHLYPDCRIFVFARSKLERDFANQLGADWSGDTQTAPPELLHAIIDTTPAWTPVVAALAALRPGGRLVINAIRKHDGDRNVLASLCYEKHLWYEKELKSVANITGKDIADFLPLAAAVPLVAQTESFALEEANLALQALSSGHLRGAKVLLVN